MKSRTSGAIYRRVPTFIRSVSGLTKTEFICDNKLDKFYFRWLENGFIEIEKAARIATFDFQPPKIKNVFITYLG